MKKRNFLLYLLLLVSVSSVKAQLNRDLSPQLNLGLTAGFNITQMDYDVKGLLEDKAKNGAGFHIGPSIVYLMPAIGIGIDASVLFDYRTAKFSDVTNRDGSSSSRLNFSQLEIPVNLRYGRDLTSMLNVFVFAGPQFNIRLNDKTIDVAGADWTVCNAPLSFNFGLGVLAMDRVQARIGYNLATKKSGEFIYNGQVRGSGKVNALQISVTCLL